jgi:hypothetical protein
LQHCNLEEEEEMIILMVQLEFRFLLLHSK